MFRKLTVALILWLGAAVAGCSSGHDVTADLAAALQEHVRFLASDSLEGRLVGTPGIEQAAEYIAGHFESMGLEPLFAGSYYQDFEIEFSPEDTTSRRMITVHNIGGMIRGTDLSNQYVVVGAHYDHLGWGAIASSTPGRREIHNGADDNASGVAAVLEIARKATAAETPVRSIAFVCFTAEELGAIGSEYYCKNPPHSIDSTVAMINLDTVGRLEDRRLIVFGAKSATEFGEILAEADKLHALELIEKEEIYGFSDQNPFYARAVPALHFFTGAYADYHSPDDDWENLDYEGLAAVTSFVADFALLLASGAEDLTAVIDLEAPAKATAPRGRGAFLGIIPDFAYMGTGAGIKGTVPKSPAEAAGLKDGDVILSIDGSPVLDLKGLMQILVEKSPGDEIEIRLVRGYPMVTLRATLGVRSEIR
jgi:acetylornithine deacetylase/succinyl-diaminopimelate desuccinylase-like protein